MDDRELASRLDKIQSGLDLILDRLGFFEQEENEGNKRGFESKREE